MVDRRFFEALMADKRLSLRALAKRMGMNRSQPGADGHSLAMLFP